MVVREPTYKKWWLDFQGIGKNFKNLIQLMDTNGKLVVWGPVVPLSMKRTVTSGYL